MKRSVAAVCRSSALKRYNDLSISLKPQDELFLHEGMCLDSDEATLEPFTPRVFRCRASFTTACFEFVMVDLFVVSVADRWTTEHGQSEGVGLEGRCSSGLEPPFVRNQVSG